MNLTDVIKSEVTKAQNDVARESSNLMDVFKPDNTTKVDAGKGFGVKTTIQGDIIETEVYKDGK